MAITGPVVVRAADGMQWQASHREAEIGAVSTRPSTLFGFADKPENVASGRAKKGFCGFCRRR